MSRSNSKCPQTLEIAKSPGRRRSVRARPAAHGTARACSAPAAQPCCMRLLPNARRAPAQLPWAPFAARTHAHRCGRRHAQQAHAAKSRDAPTCSVGEPVKVRPATDPACHCLPPPRLPTLVTSPPCSPCGWPSPSSHARSSPRPRPCPHRAAPLACNPCPCPLRHPRRGLVSAPARALPVCLVVFRSSPGRCVSAILKPRRPPSPTPSGPTPSPAATRPLLSRRHSPFPRPAPRPARSPVRGGPHRL